MRTFTLRLFAGTLLLAALPAMASAATTSYGPTAYLQHGDTPAGFACDQCVLTIEDFEDNSLDPFLNIPNGEILPPNAMSGLPSSVTDSVDGDDGSVDGNGNGGYSWFSGASGPDDNVITINFAEDVKSAGLVFTDGDSSSTNIKLEAFDDMGMLLATIDAGDLADGTFTGETAEDRFLGFQDTDGRIASLTLTMDLGLGIEIDHIHYQQYSTCIPEPASMGMIMMGMFGLAGLRRRRR